MSFLCHLQAHSIAQPFAYDDYKKTKIQEKIQEKRQNRIQAKVTIYIIYLYLIIT